MSDRETPGSELSSGAKRTLLVVTVLYAAAVIPIGIHKGSDFIQELRQSERLLHGLPLYVANPPQGIWWPPFTTVGLVPFALVARWSLALSKACWATLNVACLGWSLGRTRDGDQGISGPAALVPRLPPAVAGRRDGGRRGGRAHTRRHAPVRP